MVFTDFSKVFGMLSDLKYRVYGIHFNRRSLWETQRDSQPDSRVLLTEVE